MPTKLTSQQTLILYTAIGILVITYVAALFVGVYYLVVYPDRALPYFVIGFLQSMTTIAGFMVGNIMGVHLPLLNQMLSKEIENNASAS